MWRIVKYFIYKFINFIKFTYQNTTKIKNIKNIKKFIFHRLINFDLLRVLSLDYIRL